MKKKQKVEIGFGGRAYHYADSSEEEDDEIMEARFDDIEEEELEAGRIADQEDEEELQRQREERRLKKWKRYLQQGKEIGLDDVSYDYSDEDDELF